MLLQYIKKNFKQKIDLELIEISDVPLFNQSEDATMSPIIQGIAKKIAETDGVIIATPEHNRTIPAALKSILEWLSFKIHPLEGKPVMIVGASYYDQGSSRAQLHLRQILDAPGVNAIVLPGNEFLLGEVKEAFDSNGNLSDKRTVDFLTTCLDNFLKFVSLVSKLQEPKKEVLPAEDLYATGSISTTIQDVDMEDDMWVEKASEKVGAVSGNTYVKLDRGILTVDQLNYFLNSMPLELTYADSNNQFLYYNYNKEEDEMLASRNPGQPGNALAMCHPERTFKSVSWVISQLRSGKQDLVRVHVPTHGPDKFVVHNYKAMYDYDGNYAGINEFILDLKPTIDWYLKQTNQTLTGGSDATASASTHDDETDATASASTQ